MDGWMDGRTDGRTDRWMDGRTEGRTDRQTVCPSLYTFMSIRIGKDLRRSGSLPSAHPPTDVASEAEATAEAKCSDQQTMTKVTNRSDYLTNDGKYYSLSTETDTESHRQTWHAEVCKKTHTER